LYVDVLFGMMDAFSVKDRLSAIGMIVRSVNDEKQEKVREQSIPADCRHRSGYHQFCDCRMGGWPAPVAGISPGRQDYPVGGYVGSEGQNYRWRSPPEVHSIAMPDRTELAIKRKMGSDTPVALAKEKFLPQEISALILQELKSYADNYYGEGEKEAIITVPAYFTDEQRRATKQAGELAGFIVDRIINEPTAAALAFGLQHSREDKHIWFTTWAAEPLMFPLWR
jgi:hypothetical protein